MTKKLHLLTKIKYWMKKFILEIVCGIDMIVAMLVFMILSTIYSIPWDPHLLTWSIFFAHAPDASMAIYPFIKEWVIKKFGIPSHRPLFHHPIIVIPAAIVFCYSTAPYLGYPVAMFVSLAVINLLAHFVHDSVEEQGFHWLAPFSWVRITLQNLFPEVVPEETWRRIHNEKGKEYESGTGTEFTKRADPVSKSQLVVWLLSVALVISCGLFPKFAPAFFLSWGTVFFLVILAVNTSFNKPKNILIALLYGGWAGYWLTQSFH